MTERLGCSLKCVSANTLPFGDLADPGRFLGAQTDPSRRACTFGKVCGKLPWRRRRKAWTARQSRPGRPPAEGTGGIDVEQGGEEGAMVEAPDRRRVARITIPWHLSGFELELRLVRLLDLSLDGARIEHLEHLHEGVVCFIDLPPALGRVRLTGRVVWTRLHKGEQTLEGERHRYYQSGISFTGVTAEQQTALAASLEKLRAESDAPDRERPR